MKKDVKISVLVIILLCIIVGLLGYLHEATRKFISPLPKGFTRTIVKIVEASPGDPVIDEISRVFKKEGTKVVGKAIVCLYAESKLRIDAVNINSDGSKDRGIAQISDKWHPEVTDKEAFDYKLAIKHAYRIYKQRGNFSAWYGVGCN